MPPNPITTNTLFYGDNLPILREYVANESVDLVYLDPPFNSNRTYNVLFKDESGQEAEAQIEAFDDTWHWNPKTEETYQEIIAQAPARVATMIGALRQFIGANQMMAYLVMMAARLVELHRVLKPTGSLYLHCDPTASHYLKVILDTIFGPQNFVNEVIWKRSDAKGDTGQGAKHFGRVNDTILFYAKSDKRMWSPQYIDLNPEYVERFYKYVDPDGRRYKLDNMLGPGGAAKGNPQYEVMGVTRYWRYSQKRMQELVAAGRVVQLKPGNVPMYKRYLDESKGTPITTNWADIDLLRGWSGERLGYPTQKPLALLERIIQASSNADDLVLDPFCGCGTTIAAAQKLGRKWIGIDITHLSIALQKYRLREMFPEIEFQVIGEPEDVGSARQLAQDNRYQFQGWALSRVRAKPLGGQEGQRAGKKGSDKGIDGVINFIDDAGGKPKRVLVQVKSGHVKSGDVRDLRGAVEREGAAIGLFITLEEPTREMEQEATVAGFYHSPGWQRDYPRLQILTIADLLRGAEVKMPLAWGTFKQAQRVKQAEAAQGELEL
ncbi:MAG: restriction endonuclease [Anaerolineae bacterium]|nr:restriction endonuclease [Anaerolineae bacterium]